MSKVFEMLLNTQICKYFEDNSLFAESQFGFRKSRSTTDAVLSFVARCLDGFETGNSVCGSFFDLSKAFDTVSHSILLKKLNYYGFTNSSLDLLSSYLSNRYQAVYLNGSMSEYSLLRYGVPQGSILGPVLFIIYINDPPFFLRHECLETYLFADDLALNIITDKNDTLISGAVENFTEKVNSWCNANNLTINRNKTENIEFNLCRTHTENTVRFLGIRVESGLGWQAHVNEVSGKISRSLYLLRILKNNLPIESLLTVYYGHVYPHLNYGILLWGNHSSAKSLFILQKRAIRIIHGAPPRTHCKPLFIKLGILTLPSMYVLASLLHVKRNINQLVSCNSIHQYPTRNCSNIYINRCKYSLTQNSFNIISLNLFNVLSTHVRELPFATFRGRVRAALVNNPLYAIEEFASVEV